MNEILQHLLVRQEAMTDTLRRLVALDSPTNVPDAVNAVGRFLGEAFSALDAGVEFLPQATYGDHVRVSWGGGERQVLWVGHMDTVWPLGEAQRRPFSTARDPNSGRSVGTGPGVFDMKGGLVIGLFAVAALRDMGLKPAHRLVFLLNSDEEVGSPTSRPLIEEESRRSDAVLVLEPSRDESLVTWRKGVGRFEVKVTGLASHSGTAHERGVSAVEELAHQILRLEAMTDYGRGITVNVGVIEGGSRVNVRPSFARAAVDLRVTTAEQARQASAAILGLQPVNPKATLVVDGQINRPPWEPSARGDLLFERARRLASRMGWDLWPGGSGGGSDGNFSAALGVPTLDGLGVVGEEAHALNEWVDLESLPRRSALLAELLLDLAR